MDISLSQFQRLASKASASRDIVLTNGGTDIRTKFFHSKSSNAVSAETNRATMESFKSALTQTYGVFGEGAFQAILKERHAHSQSLRAKDILATIQLVERSLGKTQQAMVLQARYALGEAFALVPAYNTLPEEQKAMLGEGALRLLREEFAQDKDGSALRTLTEMMQVNSSALAEKLAALMRKATATLPELAGIKGVETLNKVWTKGETEAFMVNLRDPATQQTLSKNFAEVVERARAQAAMDPLVTTWDKYHTAKGDWTSKADFLDFACTFSDRLSISLTVATDRALAEALSDPSSALSQATKARFPEVFTLPVKSPEVEAAHRDLALAKRDLSVAETKWAMARAKAALSEAEMRVAVVDRRFMSTRDEVIRRSREIAEEGGKPREVLKDKYAQMAAEEKVLNEANEVLEHLRDTLKPFMDQAEKRLASLEREGSAEWVDMCPLQEMETDLKTLRERLTNKDMLTPDEQLNLLKEAMELEGMRSDCAKAKQRLLEQEAQTSLTEVRVLRDSVETAATRDPSLKVSSTIMKEIAEAKAALHETLKTQLSGTNAHFSDIASKKKEFLTEEEMTEALTHVRQTNDALFDTLEKAETLSQALAIAPRDALDSPTFLQQIKAHCIVEVRNAMQV